MARPRQLSAQQIRATVRRHDFAKTQQRGSHEKWQSGDGRSTVIVYDFRGRPLPRAAVREIIEASRIPEEEFFE
jgi:predicted RNA binding protein YcfA (HicA-like mRNA interferase family)